MNEPWFGEFLIMECENIEEQVKFSNPDEGLKMYFAGMFVTLCRLKMALKKGFERAHK